MRVVHAAKFYPPSRGGMETVVADLCEGVPDDWHSRVVAANTIAHTAHERSARLDVIRAASLGTASSVPLCPSYPWHLWRSSADCLVLHEPNPVAGVSVFLRQPTPRLVIWHHSDLVRPAWAPHTYGRFVQGALYRRADCVIVSSPSLAIGSELVRQARRVAVIPFGIALERFRSTAAVEEKIARIHASVPGPRVLFVGRFVYYKGVDVLIRAMTRVEGTLLLIGEGPLEGELRALADRLGLSGRVRFLGGVLDDELPAFYRASDVFVLPSIARTEAFGVVQVEAMAAGLPIVSTKLPTGVPWVNQHGVTGLVVPPSDAQALGEAIASLLRNPDLRKTLGSHAAGRAQALFSRERMVDAFRDVVESVVRTPERLDALCAEGRLT